MFLSQLALLVAVISVAGHFIVYQCVYKVKPRFISADRKPESGGGDAIVYDVVDERVGTTLKMKQMKHMVSLNQEATVK